MVDLDLIRYHAQWIIDETNGDHGPDPGPGPGPIPDPHEWEWHLPESFTPLHKTDYLNLQLDAPKGIVTRAEVDCVISGMPDDPQAQNLFFLLEGSDGQKGTYKDLWNYVFTIKTNQCKTRHGQDTVAAEKALLLIKPVFFDSIITTHVVSYSDWIFNTFGTIWNGTGDSEPILGPHYEVKKGARLFICGKPTLENTETAPLGCRIDSLKVTFTYQDPIS